MKVLKLSKPHSSRSSISVNDANSEKVRETALKNGHVGIRYIVAALGSTQHIVVNILKRCK